MALSTSQLDRIYTLQVEADECIAKATEAREAGSTVGAREWLDAADSALRAARSAGEVNGSC